MKERGCARICVEHEAGEVQRGDLFLSLVKWPPVFAAVLEKDYQACNSRLADSVTRTPLVCATRVAVVNVSIVRSRGPRGGMPNDLILATRQQEVGEEGESAEARPTIRFLLRFVYRTNSSVMILLSYLSLDTSFFRENNEPRSWHSVIRCPLIFKSSFFPPPPFSSSSLENLTDK